MKKENLDKNTIEFVLYEPVHGGYSSKLVKLEQDTYTYYRVERRYGPSWWLIGINHTESGMEEEQIGRLTDDQLKKFINWSKFGDIDSKIVSVKAISGTFDVASDLVELMKGKQTRGI